MLSSLTYSLLLLAAISFTEPSCLSARAEDEISHGRNVAPHNSITINQFQDLLFTEIHDEVDSISRARDDINRRHTKEEPGKKSILEDLWSDIIQHGWSLIEVPKATSNRQLRKKRTDFQSDSSQSSYPFLICNRSSERATGAQRRQNIAEEIDLFDQDLIAVYNGDDQTCFHASATVNQTSYLKELSSKATLKHNYAILPMTDIMKISVNTIAEISQPSWPPVQNTAAREDHSEWERMVRVTFAAGTRTTINNDNILSTAGDILSYAQSLGKQGAEKRRLQSKENEQISPSLMDVFSITSKQISSRRLNSSSSRKGRANMWAEALEKGLEATHNCATMFQQIVTKPHYDLGGFDIVLNPIDKHVTTTDGTVDDQKIESNIEFASSASNLHCITSLIMALSTHPSVLNVEVDTPIVNSDDYEAKMITQSRQDDESPLADAGLTGKGQIVSVIDSGCDTNNRFFGPTDKNVFDNWDMRQRKIVSYDTSHGDNDDARGGHGTAVATVVAGKANHGDTNANGIAEDAKLHIFDLGNGGKVFNAPISPNSMLKSMYNDGKGAKIANGSYSTKYSVYKTSCKFYDYEFYDNYQDVLFVASVGNSGTGADGKTSRSRTVGNPAGCKNTLAVGASQSTSSKTQRGDLGMDYLAMFSSRGPTADDRMKPDIVAPGYTVQTSKAHAMTGESDTQAMIGTSFAAAVVAGNAALVRQYFEEGWFPCGSKGCGQQISPSGSLVKATLMNGGQNLKRVQAVLDSKAMGEDLKPYDSAQGMGLLNLSSTLPIGGDSKFKGLVQNNVDIKDSNEHTFIVKATTKNNCPSPEISITLAWYDTAGVNGCTKCLLNDLDVSVQQIKWNGLLQGRRHHANGTESGDHRNNVERVRFNMRHKKKYKITVKANNLSEDSVKYSLIATGCFKVKKIAM